MTRYTPDWLQQGSYSAAMDRRVLQALYPNPASAGCAVSVGSGMTVNVAAGQVAVPTANATGSLVCTSDAVEPVALAAAPSSNSRIDLVVCQARGNDLDGGANNDFIFAPVTGTVAASPVAPAVPANAVALAQIAVGTGVAAIVAANITDARPALLNPAGEPATTSANLITKPDLTGQLWVAKGGVNGGAWRKAGDALKARVYRSAAVSPGAVNAFNAMPFDTVSYDAYGLMALSSTPFTCPLAGVWELRGASAMFPLASRFIVALFKNGTEVARGHDVTGTAAAGTGGPVTDLQPLAVGDTIQLQIFVSAASVNIGVGAASSYLTVAWHGAT
jgi:hypothetical protein